MKKVLLLGAGKSSVYLIERLANILPSLGYKLLVGDRQKPVWLSTSKDLDFAIIAADNGMQRLAAIAEATLVISLLPPALHESVAQDCLSLGKHLATASYVSQGLKAMHEEAKQKGLIFLCECGLDPGLDHLSAMKIFDQLHAEGHEIRSFESYCGGLMAPESNTNRWGYKFSWNPRNVILAGQSTARYLRNGIQMHKPYTRLFHQSESIQMPNGQCFEAYPNRDSIAYKNLYPLPSIQTLLRGTLRYPGFCDAWHVLVQLGLTDDSCTMHFDEHISYATWLQSFVAKEMHETWREAIIKTVPACSQKSFDMLEETGLLSKRPIKRKSGSPAQFLQDLLEESWQLAPNDKDLVVMQHILYHTKDGEHFKTTSSLYIQGEDALHTAMAKTVGLPLAMGVELILSGKIQETGVVIPLCQEWYEPILQGLEMEGICFEESTSPAKQ